MKWARSLFVENAKFFAMLAESQWKNGAENAKVLSDLFKERGLRKCRVLDIPCGIGRVSVPLAKHGYEVSGVDFSRYFLNIAKKKARKFGVAKRAEFSEGLMREVGSLFPEGHFDAALNIWTSIGFGSQQDDLVFFKGLRRVVRKGGLFVIGRLASRDFLLAHFSGNLYDETDDLVILERNELDVEHSRMKSEWKFYEKKGGSLRYAATCPLDLRLYSPHELVDMLWAAGWKVQVIYNSLADRRPYSVSNPSMAIISQAV